ncbi:MAG: hypothetical protein JJU01_08040 [Alkalibacterium sp.]|nr:hypothetical protein [Alkalibacterium sp.]
MPVFAEGSYDSYEDTIRAADTLVMRGHEKDDMKIVGNSSALQEYDDAAGISAVEHSKIHSEEETTVLEEYETELQSGKLILLVNEAVD